MSRLRTHFCKTDRSRFVSHLDLLRTFERALRRANIPIAFSQGFNPHPKISFGPALPVGIESYEEYVDFVLKEPYNPEVFKSNLNKHLPPGLTIQAVQEIDPTVPALTAEINLSAYRIIICFVESHSKEEVWECISRFLERSEIMITKKAKKGVKQVNIRPLIRRLQLVDGNRHMGEQWELFLAAQGGPQGNLRADELNVELKKFLPPIEYIQTSRIGQYIEREKQLYSPFNDLIRDIKELS